MSPSLILFFSLALLLALSISTLVLLPWLINKSNRTSVNSNSEHDTNINTNTNTNNDATTNNQADDQLMSLNVATFKQRLEELKQDNDEGTIDSSQYQSQKTELERQLLQAQTAEQTAPRVGLKSRMIFLLWIPVLVSMVYLLVSNRSPVFELWTTQDSVGEVADQLLTGKIDTPPTWAIESTEDSQALITAMQSNVHHHAHDANRWMRLSELFLSLKATDQALQAMERANRLDPTNDEIATAYVKVSYFANGEQMTDKSKRILQTLLTSQPNHEGAIMLMVMGETKAGNHQKALAWVERLRSSIKSKSGDHSKALASLDTLTKTIENNMNQASRPSEDTQFAQTTDNKLESSDAISVQVTITAELIEKIQPDDVIFVTVRDSNGGAPYAVKKIPVNQLTSTDNQMAQLSVVLSDKDAMLPTRTISIGKSNGLALVVNARVSHTGQAMTESGDLIATTPIELSATQQQANIEINTQLP